MSTPPPPLICLTPVRNEAWILDRFLQCASTWADHIILADQHSTDGTRSIARRYEKVHLIDNDCEQFDEAARQQLLIDAARDIPSPTHRILLALDADEVLSANWMDSPDWTRIRSAPPGTVLQFQWANVAPGVETGWIDPDVKPFGFVDDGSPHEGKLIHSPRIPVPNDAPTLHLEDIRVLHYQYANWERMESKQRWYQCWERLNNPEKRPITIYRQYNFMHADVRNARPLRPDWIAGYEERGIDMRTVETAPYYHWDRAVVNMLMEHGTEPFEKIAIWKKDWAAVGRELGYDHNGELTDPRGPFTKLVHAWLRLTQPWAKRLPIRITQKLLQPAGW